MCRYGKPVALIGMTLVSEEPPRCRVPVMGSGLRCSLETWAIRFDLRVRKRRGTRFRIATLTLAKPNHDDPWRCLPGRRPGACRHGGEHVGSGVRPAAGSALLGVIINCHDVRVRKGCKALVDSEVPIINIRHDQDNWMMGILPPEHLFPD